MIRLYVRKPSLGEHRLLLMEDFFGFFKLKIKDVYASIQIERLLYTIRRRLRKTCSCSLSIMMKISKFHLLFCHISPVNLVPT